MTEDRFQFTITVLVGLAALALPYGFLVGLVVGTFLIYAGARFRRLRLDV